MDQYLRRIRTRIRADAAEDSIHAVLGGPEPDVDTVAATLCLALHLSQTESSDTVCVPVFCRRRGDVSLPRETTKFLQRVRICESLLLWRDDVDLLRLHQDKKLSLTLLRDGLMDSSEQRALDSCVLRVVHQAGQQDAEAAGEDDDDDDEDDGAVSAVATVSREILQEAARRSGAALTESLGEALRLQSEALWIKHGLQSVHLEQLRQSLDQWSMEEPRTQDLELDQDLSEFSDGEMTIGLAAVATGNQDWNRHVDSLKSFSRRRGYDGLMVVLSISDPVLPPRHQVAVYSNNSDILNQMCCELEESSSWSVSGDLDPTDSLQLYHVPVPSSSPADTPPLTEQVRHFLKEFVDRRSSVLACRPSSRTSSTEGVAGSVEFSQGSSGINDMDGSDVERVEGGGDTAPTAPVMADGEEDAGSVGVGAGGELVSPDSGMTTIRSSRSSKESSVFLSDDSPVGEIMAAGGSAVGPGGLFLRNPSPLGLLSLSPPVPPERRRNHSGRNRSENFDLFSFDPLHNNDQSLPAGGEPATSGGRGDTEGRRAGSSSLSEYEELSLMDFSGPNSLGGLESRNSSIDHHGQIHDTVVPPTPVNSLVGSRPPSSCGARFFPEDVVERINGLQHKDSVSSSLSETWDELGFDTQGALSSSDNNVWNRTRESESPQNISEEAGGKESTAENREKALKSENCHHRGTVLEPQLSLITEQVESYDNWNLDSVTKDQWNLVTLADLQLTPPEEEVFGKCKAGLIGIQGKTPSLSKKKTIPNTLTPDTSKEEDEGLSEKKGSGQVELLDFWTYSAQKGFLKSDSGTTTSYPESLDMWNMTIRDDSLSPLTTPDNLSEKSGSFCGLNPDVRADTSVESPLGFSDGGMEMWNTTIQEDSSSTITSPEGPENGQELSHMGSLEANEPPETTTKQIEEEESANKVLTPGDIGWRGNKHNVKIVIESVESRKQAEETDDNDNQSQMSVTQNLVSELPKDETPPDRGRDLWDLPVPSMVTSTSEYDNVGGGSWSLTSSPETFASPMVDMIQLEDQSSPFIAVGKPPQIDEPHDQYQVDSLVISDKEQADNQVFRFESKDTIRSGERSTESKHDTKSVEGLEKTDCGHSPFILLDDSSVTQLVSAKRQSHQGEAAETQIQTLSPNLDWESLDSKKGDSPESTSVRKTHSGDESTTENQLGLNTETNGNVGDKTTETMSLSSSSGGERDTMKFSPDSLHPGSQDDLRSNSDGDSSSGLEMENILVSGTVKEADREWNYRPKEADRQSKGTRKSMETFSMLSYAATVLQIQAQAARREQENAEQTRQNNEGTFGDIQKNQAASETTTDQTDLNDDESSLDASRPFMGKIRLPENADQPMVTETFSPNKLKTNSQPQPDSRPTTCSQTQIEEGNYEDKSNIVARSVSPSLRYSSDHFLKTREEVYVHSQISMEESDEGGQSPSPTPPCPSSLGNFQVWGGQDTPQSTSEPESPALTNSSASHASSMMGTPLSEDRGLGLPFSGDLMEDEKEQDEETDPEIAEERPSQGSDLLSFTEELIGGSGLQTIQPQRDGFLLNPEDSCNGRPVDCDQYSGAFQEHHSPSLRRRQEVTSQLLPQTANGNVAFQWTGSQNLSPGQTQYGYNYHHIDQRTENQGGPLVCVDPKPGSQEVYAEFTSHATADPYGPDHATADPFGPDHATADPYGPDHATADPYGPDHATADPYGPDHTTADPFGPDHATADPYGPDHATADQYGPDHATADQYGPDHSYYVPGGNEGYASDQAGSGFQYRAESGSVRYPDQKQYDPDPTQYRFEERPIYQSQAELEDHARYVPEEYAHFLLSRNQGDEAAGTTMMMMRMKIPSGEEAEDVENREDVSAGSNQRRKLAAPPLDVSLDQSEGSVLSEDLDTEDEALDTGDDLDLNIDEMDTSDEGEALDISRHRASEAAAGPGSPGPGSGGSGSAGPGSADQSRDQRLWRSVVIGEQEHRIDMKSIQPYRRVISHGGYYAEQNAIIVFAACFLPDSDCDNYTYVMENLFLYVISTLELMVAEDYMIVYLNGATPRRRMPGFTWMKKCYQMIDRRLKKNLKLFIIVHPSWFIRTLLGITRPFISSKFSSKIKYVNSLRELGDIIPMDYVHIPASIVKLDTELQDSAAKADKKGNSSV